MSSQELGKRTSAGLAARLGGLLDGVTKFSWYLSGLALFLILFSYVLEVVMRYFFGVPTSWTNDYIQWFLAAMIMLALPEVTRLKAHIVISFFLEKMQPQARERLGRILALAGFVVCSLAAAICLQETWRQGRQGIETLWNDPISKAWISAFIPYGLALSGLQMLRQGLSRTSV